jgi:general secretion pathway protein A
MNALLSFFGFSSHPFGRATPPGALLRHRGFTEALSRLRFAAETDAIAELVAEPGLGKTLLLAELAAALEPQGFLVLYFAHTTTGPFGFVNVLARKLGLSPARSRAETAFALTRKTREDHPRLLLVLDEVQDMPDATLADLRLLTIDDFDRSSPFRLVLSGQPALHDRLAQPPHRALDQRITTCARLLPLSLEETRLYLDARLAAVGAARQPLFHDAAVEALFDSAAGVPRALNHLATGALLVAATQNRRVVSAQDVHDARIDRGRP